MRKIFDEQYWICERTQRDYDLVARNKTVGERTHLAFVEQSGFLPCGGPYSFGIWIWGNSYAELATALAATHYRDILACCYGAAEDANEFKACMGMTFSDYAAHLAGKLADTDLGREIEAFVRFMTEEFIPAAEHVRRLSDLEAMVARADELTRGFPLTSHVTLFGSFREAIYGLNDFNPEEYRIPGTTDLIAMTGEQLRDIFFEDYCN